MGQGADQADRRTRGPRLLFVLLLLSGCGQAPPEIAELSGGTMGTSYSIKLSPAPPVSRLDELRRSVERRLETINRQMSTYQDDSDLTRFNLARSTDWQPLPGAVVELVEQANRISRLTDGRYDVTVGPLVNLWGFGNSGSRDRPPSDKEIVTLLAQVGFRNLHSRRNPPALRKMVAELQVDLSSIAKGWAVDQIAELLLAQGFENFLVEIGGELRAQGQKSASEPWRIAIEQPSFDSRIVQRVFELHDMAMATSGDYRNFFAADGQVYSHTIDPRTGQPVQDRLASVTVLAENCAEADAWATALMSLGERQAPVLADRLDLKALFIVRTVAGLREQRSRTLADSRLWPAQAH